MKHTLTASDFLNYVGLWLHLSETKASIDGPIKLYPLNPNPNSLEAFTGAGNFETSRTLTVICGQCLTVLLKGEASYIEHFKKIYKTTQSNILFQEHFDP